MSPRNTPFLVRRVALVVLTAALQLWPTHGSCWQATLTGQAAVSVAVDAAGDVVAMGYDSDRGLEVGKFVGGTGVPRWEQVIEGVYPLYGRFYSGAGFFEAGRTMALDASGDVVVVASQNYIPAVLKFSGATGALLWRRDFPTPLKCAFFNAVTIDGADDVVAAGSLDGSSGCDFAVVTLSGTYGSELWRYTLDGTAHESFDEARAIAVDADGNAVAAGRLHDRTGSTDHFDLTVVKLAAVDGSELWRVGFSGTSEVVGTTPVGLAVDASGDVVVGGSTGDEQSHLRNLTVTKLSGTDGTQLWQYVPGDGIVGTVRIDAAGDVVAAGEAFDSPGFSVVKLSGSTGSEVWRAAAGPQVYDVAIDGIGDAVVGGTLPMPGGPELFVARLAGGSGNQVWGQWVDGTQPHDIYFPAGGVPNAIALGAGHVAVAANISNTPYYVSPLRDFVVVDFGGGMTGKRLSMRDSASDHSKRRLTVQSKDPRILAGGVGTPADPTVSGAVLTITNPTTGETASVALPAGSWKALPMRIPGFRKYRYADHVGACRSVVLWSAKELTARCAGSGLAFSLDEPAQGSLDVRLAIDSAFEYCMHFGGTVRKDTPAAGAALGAFDAADAPAPSCPASDA